MRTLSYPLLTALRGPITQPGYLVYLGYSAPRYLSTMGSIDWDSRTWIGSDQDINADIKVSSISNTGTGESTATITLDNTNSVWSALILNEGAADIVAKVWACYTGAVAPVLVFDGATDGADIDAKNVTMQLAASGNKTQYAPRIFISKPTFNHLQPAGTKLTWGNETFVLERKN